MAIKNSNKYNFLIWVFTDLQLEKYEFFLYKTENIPNRKYIDYEKPPKYLLLPD